MQLQPEAIAAVLGPAKVSEPRPQPGLFTPHVSAAYINSDGPAQPITNAVSTTDPQPVTATFGTASLLVSHRDHRMYEWTHATPLSIGPVKSAALATLPPRSGVTRPADTGLAHCGYQQECTGPGCPSGQRGGAWPCPGWPSDDGQAFLSTALNRKDATAPFASSGAFGLVLHWPLCGPEVYLGPYPAK